MPTLIAEEAPTQTTTAPPAEIFTPAAREHIVRCLNETHPGIYRTTERAFLNSIDEAAVADCAMLEILKTQTGGHVETIFEPRG